MDFEVTEFLRDLISEKKPKLKDLLDSVFKHFNHEPLLSDISFVQQQYRKIVAEEWSKECLDILKAKIEAKNLKDDEILELMSIFRSLQAFEKTPYYLQGDCYKMIQAERTIFTPNDFIKPRKEITMFLNYLLINLDHNTKMDFMFYELLIKVLRNSYLDFNKLSEKLQLQNFVDNNVTIYQLSRNVIANNFSIDGYQELKKVSHEIRDEHSMVKALAQRHVKKYLKKLDKEDFLSGGIKILKLQKKILLSDNLDVQIPADVKEVHVICDILHIDKGLPEKYRGKNVFVVSNTIRLHKTTIWDLSGRDAPQKYSTTAGKFSNGDGKDGGDGEPGESGGNCEIISAEINSAAMWTIKSNGGNGSDGQDGGNGTDGANGHDVNEDDFKILGQKITKANFMNLVSQLGVSTEIGSRRKNFYENGLEKLLVFNRNSSSSMLLLLIRGSKGKVGALGGFGGFCGREGFAGKINVNSEDEGFVMINDNGNDGKIGQHGFNGRYGQGGRDAYMKISTNLGKPLFGGLNHLSKYEFSMHDSGISFSIFYEPLDSTLYISETSAVQETPAAQRNYLALHKQKLAKDEQSFCDNLVLVLKNAKENFNELTRKLKIREFVDLRTDYKDLASRIVNNNLDIFNYDVLQGFAKFVTSRPSKIESQIRELLRNLIKGADVNHKSGKIYECRKMVLTTTELSAISESFDELHVFCNTLHVNSILSEKFRGRKMAIYANTINIHKSVELDFSGFDNDGGENDNLYSNGGDFFIDCNFIENASLLTIKSNGGNGKKVKSGVDAKVEDFHINGRSLEGFSSTNIVYTDGSFTKFLVKNSTDSLLIVKGSNATRRRVGSSGNVSIKSNDVYKKEIKVIAQNGLIGELRDGRDIVMFNKNGIKGEYGTNGFNKYELVMPRFKLENSVNYSWKNFSPKLSCEITYKTGIDDVELCENLVWVLRNAHDQLDNLVNKLKLNEFVNRTISLEEVAELIRHENLDIGNYSNLKKYAENFVSIPKYQNSIREHLEKFLVTNAEIKYSDTILIKQLIYNSSNLHSVLVNSNVKEIQIICDTLHIDSALPQTFRGKNVAVLANYVQVHKNVTWDLSGLPVPSNIFPSKAGQHPDGTGKDGEDGRAGNSGGNFSLHCKLIENPSGLTIVSNGGDGNNGQAGGDGKNGEDGEDAKSSSFKKNDKEFRVNTELLSAIKLLNEFKDPFITDDYLKARCYIQEKFFVFAVAYYALMLVEGTDGKHGKSGGLPGYGGQGGLGGEISIKSENDESQKYVQIKNKSGNDGNNGAASYNGARGKDGRDLYRYDHNLKKKAEEYGNDTPVKYKTVSSEESKDSKDPYVYDYWKKKYVHFEVERKIETSTRSQNNSKLSRNRSFLATAKKNSSISMHEIRRENIQFLNNSVSKITKTVDQLNIASKISLQLSTTTMKSEQQKYIQGSSPDLSTALIEYNNFQLRNPTIELEAAKKSDILVNSYISKYSDSIQASQEDINELTKKYRDMETEILTEETQIEVHTTFQVKFNSKKQFFKDDNENEIKIFYYDLLRKLLDGSNTSELLAMIRASRFDYEKYKYLFDNIESYQISLSKRNFVNNKNVLNKAVEKFIGENAKNSVNPTHLELYQLYQKGDENWKKCLKDSAFLEQFVQAVKERHPYYIIDFFKNSMENSLINIDDLVTFCGERILLKFYSEIFSKMNQQSKNIETSSSIASDFPNFEEKIGFLRDSEKFSSDIESLNKQFNINREDERKEILDYFHQNFQNYYTSLPEAVFNLLIKYSDEFEDSMNILGFYDEEAQEILQEEEEKDDDEEAIEQNEADLDIQKPVEKVLQVLKKVSSVELRPNKLYYSNSKKEKYVEILKSFYDDEGIKEFIDNIIMTGGIKTALYRRLLAHKYGIGLTIFVRNFDGSLQIIEQHNYDNQLKFEYHDPLALWDEVIDTEGISQPKPKQELFLLERYGEYSVLNFEDQKYLAFEKRKRLEDNCKEIVEILSGSISKPYPEYLKQATQQLGINKNKVLNIFDEDNFWIDIDTSIEIILSHFPYTLVKYDESGPERMKIDDKIEEKLSKLINADESHFEIKDDESLRYAIRSDLNSIARIGGLPILKAVGIKFSHEKNSQTLQEFQLILELILEFMCDELSLKYFLTFLILGIEQDKWSLELIILKLEKLNGVFDEKFKKKWRQSAKKIKITKIYDLFLQKIIDVDEKQVELEINDFDGIFDNLNYFDENDLSILTKTSLLSWKTTTAESYWKQEIEKLRRNRNDKIEDLDEVKAIFEDINNKYGEKSKKLLKLLQLRKNELKALKLVSFLGNFKSGEWQLSGGSFNILSTKPVNEWTQELEKYYNTKSGERKAPEVVRLIKDDSETSESVKNIVGLIESQVQEMFELVCPVKRKRFILYDSNEINEWRERFSNPPVLESLAVITRMFQIMTKNNITLRDTQLMSILTMWYSQKGVLVQVSTGEGKTFIGVSFAILKVIYGEKVDIITSSSVLASRDAEESRKYFNFFGISVDHNCYEDTEKRKKAYSSQVVYGILGNFQRDYLLTEFFEHNFLSDRERSNVLVDEVDSMLLDKGNNILYLSSDLPDIDEIESVFVFLWHYVNQEFSNGMNAVESLNKELIRKVVLDVAYGLLEEDDIQQMNPNINAKEVIETLKNCNILDEENSIQKENYSDVICDWNLSKFDENTREKIKIFCRNKIESDKIVKIPNYLRSFVRLHLDKWIENAIRALVLENENEYIIDRPNTSNEVSSDPNVIIVDLDTGTDMTSSQWDEGLHQFLQLKHGCKLSLISLKSVFISNVSYFKKYRKLYGMSGTLGSLEERKKTARMNKIDYVTVPRFAVRKFTEYKAILEADPHKWIQEITNEVIKIFNGNRSVLIICETIQDTKIIRKALLADSQYCTTANVHVYQRDSAEFKIGDFKPKHVIVATNLAGRGTDIKLSDKLKEAGGLHVILSYLPQNARIEDQTFGRAARAGDKGSGRLIIQRDSEDDIYHMKSTRNKNELERLDDVNAYYENFIQIEEDFFKKFQDTYKTLKEIGKDKNVTPNSYMQKFIDNYSGFDDARGTEAISIYLENFKLQWSFWLDKNAVHLDNWKKSKAQSQVYTNLNNFLSNAPPIHPVRRTEIFKYQNEKKEYDKAKDAILTDFQADSIAFQYYKCYTILKNNLENEKHFHRDLHSEEQQELIKCMKMLEERIDQRSMRCQLINKTNNEHQMSLVTIQAFEKQQKLLNQTDEIFIDSIQKLFGYSITPDVVKTPDINKDVFAKGLYDQLLSNGALSPPKVSSLFTTEDVRKCASANDIKYEELNNFLDTRKGSTIHPLKDFGELIKANFSLPSLEEFWETLLQNGILTDEVEYAIIDLKAANNTDPSFYNVINDEMDAKNTQNSNDNKILRGEISVNQKTEIFFLDIKKSIENKGNFVMKMENLKSQISSKRLNFLKNNGVIETNKRANFNVEKFNKLKSSKIFSKFDEIRRDEFKDLCKNYDEIIEKLTRVYEDNRTILKKRGENTFSLNHEHIHLIESSSDLDIFKDDAAVQPNVAKLIKAKFAYRIALCVLADEINQYMKNVAAKLHILNSVLVKLQVSPHISLISDFVSRHIVVQSKADKVRINNIDKCLNALRNQSLYNRLGSSTENSISIGETETYLQRNWKNSADDKENIEKKLKGLYQALRNEDFTDVDVVLKPLEDFLQNPEQRELLEFMKAKGFNMVIQVDQKKYSLSYWLNFTAVLAIAAVQVIFGAVIMIASKGLAYKAGEFLLSEGIGDAIFALGTLTSGVFRWSDYGKHKAISVCYSLASCLLFGVCSHIKKLKQFFKKSKTFTDKMSQKLGTKITSVKKLIQGGGAVGKTVRNAALKGFGKLVAGSAVKSVTLHLLGLGAQLAIENILDGIIKKVAQDIVETLTKFFWTRGLAGTIETMLQFYSPSDVNELIFKELRELSEDYQLYTEIVDKVCSALKVVEIISATVFAVNILDQINDPMREKLNKKGENDKISSNLEKEQIKEIQTGILDQIKNEAITKFSNVIASSVVKPVMVHYANKALTKSVSACVAAYKGVKGQIQKRNEKKYRKTADQIIQNADDGVIQPKDMKEANKILKKTRDPQLHADLVQLDIPMNPIAIDAATIALQNVLGTKCKIIVGYEGRSHEFGDGKAAVVTLENGHFANSKNSEFGNNCFYDALCDAIPELRNKLTPQGFRNQVASVILNDAGIKQKINDSSYKYLLQSKFSGGSPRERDRDRPFRNNQSQQPPENTPWRFRNRNNNTDSAYPGYDGHIYNHDLIARNPHPNQRTNVPDNQSSSSAPRINVEQNSTNNSESNQDSNPSKPQYSQSILSRGPSRWKIPYRPFSNTLQIPTQPLIPQQPVTEPNREDDMQIDFQPKDDFIADIGSYGHVCYENDKNFKNTGLFEIHHEPPDNCYKNLDNGALKNLNRNLMPSMRLPTALHRMLISTGTASESQLFRDIVSFYMNTNQFHKGLKMSLYDILECANEAKLALEGTKKESIKDENGKQIEVEVPRYLNEVFPNCDTKDGFIHDVRNLLSNYVDLLVSYTTNANPPSTINYLTNEQVVDLKQFINGHNPTNIADAGNYSLREENNLHFLLNTTAKVRRMAKSQSGEKKRNLNYFKTRLLNVSKKIFEKIKSKPVSDSPNNKTNNISDDDFFSENRLAAYLATHEFLI